MATLLEDPLRKAGGYGVRIRGGKVGGCPQIMSVNFKELVGFGVLTLPLGEGV
jgi:hypothetical protein